METALDALLAGGLEAHLQPVVRLAGGQVVGHEALARGPRGSAFESPAAMFAAARDLGRVADLDRACLAAALTAGRRAGCETLFVNVESSLFDGHLPAEPLAGTLIVEITERDILSRPAELLHAVDRLRASGYGVAVDDLGAAWGSLALLPLLRPDVVKLDRQVLALDGGTEAARIVRAARAYVDRSGATLLAEGLEDARHAGRAQAFGATLGQGWHFGRPAPAAQAAATAGTGRRLLTVEPDPPGTPFELLERRNLARAVGTKREILALSMDLETEGREARDPIVLLSTFQTVDRFTARTRERYARIARGAALVGVFAVGLEPEPVPFVRGADLSPEEPLADEWIVSVVGPHQAAGLFARDLGDAGVPDMDRRFEYALVTDRELVEQASRSLLRRVVAAPAEAVLGVA